MNVKSVDKKENNTAVVVVEVDKEQFSAALDQAYRKNRNDIAVPGFRRGKAPRKVVEGMYGASIFYEDAVNILYPSILSEAIESQDLKTVGYPSVDDMDVSEGVLTLTLNVALYPEVTLGEYKGVEAEKPAVSVPDDDVNTEIESLLTRNSRLVPVSRPIQDGDTAVIDFEGFDNGVPFEGGKGEKYDLVIGSGSFVPGFEEQLIGISAGENKSVELTFPEDYAENLAGKPVVFECYVHEVKETVKPDLDDEFAKDVSEYDTLAELKDSIRQRITKERENSAEKTFESNVIEQVVKNMTCVVPETMISMQVDKIMENFNYQMQMNGLTMEDYLRMMGTDMQTMRANYRPMALRQIQSELALSKVAEVEGIEITEEDMEAEYKRLSEEHSMEVEKIKELIPAEDLISDLKIIKATELVKSAAKAVEAKQEEAEEEAETEKE